LETTSFESEDHQLATFPSDCTTAEEAVKEVPVEETAEEPTGDLLVVEPDDNSSFTVIQGKQFRQLFNQLESSNGLPKFG